MEEPDVEQLPKTVIRRVVKEKLSDLSGGDGDSQLLLHKDALLAFSEASRVFIHYLSATANDICKESRRQIVNAEDVFNALDEIQFSDLVCPLKASLDVYRDIHAEKRDAVASKVNESAKNGKKSANGNISKSLKPKNVSNTKNKNSATGSAKNSKKKVPNGREIKPKDRNITIISKDGTSNKAKKK